MSEALELGWLVLARLANVWRSREVWVGFLLIAGLVVLTPRLTGVPWRAYWNRGLFTDLLYTLFFLGGIHALLFSGPADRGLNALVTRYVPSLRQDLLGPLPAAAAFLVLIVVMDFFGYWTHRLLHLVPALWLFHGVHHSQTELNAFTSFRFHAGEVFFRTLVQFVPFTLLGSPDLAGVPLLWITAPLSVLHLGLVHCDLPWSFGGLGRVVISPAFHRIHHSAEGRHHHANYGGVFTFWDALFGTADWSTDRPAAYGAPRLDVPESFVRQFVFPFRALARRLPAAAGEPATAGEPAPAPGRTPS